MSEKARGRTSEVEMIASRVVQNQANVCTVIMKNITDKLDGLVAKVDALERTVITMDKSLVDVRGRLKLFTIAATVAGFIAGIAGLIQLFK